MIVCIEVKSPLRCYDNFEASPSEYSTQFLLLFPISCKFVAMKQKLKQIASLAALLIALLMSVDDGIAFFADVDVVQVPVTGVPDGTHHQHVSFTDHFFQKNTDSRSESRPVLTIYLADNYHYTPGAYLSSIWQPPKSSC